ncbi:SGNH/GDSL hydrolase family protein [Streptomyces eurythermus]|uniref:SGNH/GDSL hydrolase family protein n=1 Tax=Streptomyces eurythermus TaxID=42237 RepID=UPI0033D00787
MKFTTGRAALTAGVAVTALMTGAGVAPSTAAAAASTPGPSAAPVRYVALGDSVAAGVGAGAPNANADSCFRADGTRIPNSTRAYPRLVAKALGARLDFRAFCGANTKAVINEQLGALNRRTKLVTVQVGANDFGFTGVVKKCILFSGGSICNNAIAEVQRAFLQKLPGRLDKVYRAIHIKAPNARVLAVGYPKLVRQRGSGCYADGLMGLGTRQKLNAATHTLNDVTAIAAQRRGIEFVAAEKSFKGHAVCEDPEWINGISYPDTVESFHPNASGHRAFGWLIWQKVKP